MPEQTEFRIISEDEAKQFELDIAVTDKKAANFYYNNGFAVWKRFKNFEKNPPFGLFDSNGELKSVAFVSNLVRRSVINVYLIVSKGESSGFGKELWKNIQKYYSEREVQNIKFKALWTSVKFYEKMGFYFWGFDGTSFVVDQPLFKTIEENIAWREEFLRRGACVYDEKLLEDKPSTKKIEEEIKIIKSSLKENYKLN